MKAADVMTPRVITIRPTATIESAIRLMLQDDLSGLPVVDAQGVLVGIVTEGDFLRRAEIGTDRRRPRWLEFFMGPGPLAAEYVRSHARTISDVMSPDVITVEEQADLRDVIEVMEKHGIKRVPVMREGRMVGIISRSNVLRPLSQLLRGQNASENTDTTIRMKLLAELAGQSWASLRNANIVVKDGVVDLYGVIFDGREREALRVAAENVPGIKQIRDHLTWIEPHTGIVIADSRRADNVASTPAR